MQKRASDLLGFRCSFLSFRCCAIYISITAWNCDFPRFLPDFEPFVLVSPDFWICGLYIGDMLLLHKVADIAAKML
ncbi:hypothetical protein, partial [Xylanibacter rodentium]|uniref:hypothetical protein n=1 Tax=Xylanibacter rodentium TaxID=2736289 RepID=UPI0025841204